MDSPPPHLPCQPAGRSNLYKDPSPERDVHDPIDGPTRRAFDNFLFMRQGERSQLVDEILEQAAEDTGNSEIVMLLGTLLRQKAKKDIDEIWDAFASVTRRRGLLGYPTMDLNPWIDLPQSETDHANLTNSAQPTNPSSAVPFRLQRLPPELIVMIAEYLPYEAKIALSLANRQLYGLLRRYCPNITESPSKQEKFQVLRLLERDHESMVACPSCYVLYTSYQSHASSGRCTINGMHRAYQYSVPYFTNMSIPFLNYNIIRSIAKQRVRDMATGTDQCSALMETLKTTRTVALTGVRAIRTSDAKFVKNGSLVLRSQLLVAPMTEGYLTPTSTSFVKYCLTEHGQRFCTHCDPREILDSRLTGRDLESDWDFRPRNLPFYNTDFMQLDNRSRDEDGDGFWYKLHPEVRRILGPHKWGYFGRCDKCAAEFAITPLRTKSIGLILVITNWKDLGGPSDGDRYSDKSLRRFNWDSHFEDLETWNVWETEDLDCKVRRAAGLTSTRGGGVETIANSFESLLHTPEPPPMSTAGVVETKFRPYVEPSTVEKLIGLQDQESMSPDEFWDFFGLEE